MCVEGAKCVLFPMYILICSPSYLYFFCVRGQAKHKHASPLIIEAAEEDGGLYDIYHTLDAMQMWKRPKSEGEGTT